MVKSVKLYLFLFHIMTRLFAVFIHDDVLWMCYNLKLCRWSLDEKCWLNKAFMQRTETWPGCEQWVFSELATYSLSATMPLIIYGIMCCWLHVSVECHTLGLGYISITDIWYLWVEISWQLLWLRYFTVTHTVSHNR